MAMLPGAYYGYGKFPIQRCTNRTYYIVCLFYLPKERKPVSYCNSLGTFVKIYGIVGLSSFFFVKNKKKFIATLIIGAVAFLAIPMLYSSVHFGLQSYTDWYVELVKKTMIIRFWGICRIYL